MTSYIVTTLAYFWILVIFLQQSVDSHDSVYSFFQDEHSLSKQLANKSNIKSVFLASVVQGVCKFASTYAKFHGQTMKCHV